MSDFTYEYLPWRGVLADTFRYYSCPTKIGEDGEPISIGFKYPEGGHKVRNLTTKHFYVQGEVKGLFGRNLFAAGSHKYVTITEGELDALSLYQVLHSPVVSVQSASTARRDCVVDRDWLNGFERVYLAFDSDVAGREAVSEVARLFDFNKVYDVKFSNRKDANEYLQHGEEGVLRNVWWNAKKYLPANIKSSLTDFREILSKETKMGIPYPWPTLNEMTYGIRPAETVLITAQEGVGKTEMMHAIEHHILKETDYNVGAIFIEEPERRHLQALAGLELQRPAHLPGCSQAENVAALEKLVQTDDRLFVYSHFGSDDPDVLLDTIRFLVSGCSCRVVMLDHISMVVSGLSGEDERKALDYLSTRLEMMVKELNFSLIMVSHVNDEGRTRGSRYISKVADIRIDARRELDSPTEETRNRTYLTVSKNRYYCKSGPAGILEFSPTTYSLKEVTDAREQLLPNDLPATNDNIQIRREGKEEAA